MTKNELLNKILPPLVESKEAVKFKKDNNIPTLFGENYSEGIENPIEIGETPYSAL